MNTQWLKEERKIHTFDEHEREPNYVTMFFTVSYRISSTSGSNNKNIFYFTWHKVQSQGISKVGYAAEQCHGGPSHPQHIGDFFRDSCKMNAGVPDVICRHDHVQQRRGSVASCESLLMSEENLSQMLLADFYWGPIGQGGFTNSCPGWQRLLGRHQQSWHRNVRGSNHREEEKAVP